jgi:hypothetical protein
VKEIIPTIITSVTSIIIALITAGVFNMMKEKRAKQNSRNKLSQQIETDEIVHSTLREIRRKYNADRIYVIQFHNGGNFYTSSAMQKASVTYERCSDGLERITDKIQNVFVSHYNWLIKQTMEEGLFIHDCELISDISTRALIKKFGTQSMVSLPITDRDNHLIALLCMDWVFSEHIEIYCENEEFTKTFVEEFKTDTESVKNFLI